MKYKVLGREFPTLQAAVHFLEVSIRLEKNPKKIIRYKQLLKGLK
jgi:hypothetical protein